MLGKCFAIFCSVSVIYAAFTGNLSALSDAVFSGAEKAVTLSISLLGIMCLWNGVMELLRAAGMIRRLSVLLRPVLSLAFPCAYKTGAGADEITANVSANLLGIGNAATPLAISAMGAMQNERGKDDTDDTIPNDTMTDDMVTLAVLNASSLDLFPTTLIAMRRAAHSADPYSVIVPIWICSAACSVLAVFLCRIFAAGSRRYERRRRKKANKGCGAAGADARAAGKA